MINFLGLFKYTDMTADKLSILLEVFSFFFVTLDLFGKERLNNIYGRITDYLKYLQEFQYGEVPKIILIPIGLFFLAVFAILYIKFFKFFMWQIPRTTPYVLGSLALMFVVLGFFIWVWLHVSGYCIGFMISVLDVTVG